MSRVLTIDSKSNPRIKEYRKLKDKKHRREQNLFLVEGFRLLEEAFKAGLSVEAVLYDPDKEGDFQRYVQPYLQEEEVIKTSRAVLAELSETVHPQGIIAVVKLPPAKELPQTSTPESAMYLYLDGLQDPGNLGTILRSAHAAGAAGVLFGPGTVDPFGDKVVRSAMGSLFHVPLYLSGLDTLETLVSQGYALAVTSLDAKEDLFQADLTGNLIMVIGNEGSGITPAMAKRGDILLKIPMPGGAESLNAAVAASIILFERVRQLGAKTCTNPPNLL